jgi:prophage antirepressor-like protein
VLVNGQATALEAYLIDGNNFFMLRDLAYALNGTDKQFSVGWDGAANAISLTSGEPYEPIGGEMTQGAGAAMTANPTTSRVFLDGAELNLTAFNIGGNNFFRLRDLMSALDIGVTWDGATSTIGIDTSIGYTED